MVLESVSLSDWYLGSLLLFTLVFGAIAIVLSPNDLWSIAQYVAAAAGFAAFVAAAFAVGVWIVVRIAA